MKGKTSSRSGNSQSFTRNTLNASDDRWSVRGLTRRIKAKHNAIMDGILVIGIDFGTTYSGVAWATSEDLEGNDINVITSWPGSGREQGKAPTELCYDKNQVSWGFQVPPDADPVGWFKLLLLRDEDIEDDVRQSDYYLRAKKNLDEHKKTPVDLIADYLRVLWQHSLYIISKARGESVIAALAFHVVITVPVVWKDYALTAMRQAADKAGILKYRSAGPTSLSFAPEPEAAALATLHENGGTLKPAVQAGDTYVICDAGGGTVDLVTYKIEDFENMDLLKVVVGRGGLCGGILIDEQFERLCKQRLGRQWNNLNPMDIRAIMKGKWEHTYKPSFTGKESKQEYPVDIPDQVFRGSDRNDRERKPHIIDGRILFSSGDIEPAFAGVASSIETLIHAQIKKTRKEGLSVDGVLLVGGLGASPYLYDLLKTRYEKQGIEIVQASGLRPCTSICRGAILKGLCSLLSNGGGALQQHMTNSNAQNATSDDYHNENSDATPYCDVCVRAFVSNKALQQHLENSDAHIQSPGDNDGRNDADAIPYCEVCVRAFISTKALLQHLENSDAHNRTFSDNDSSDESDTVPYCEDCDRTFVSVEALRQHLENSNAHTEAFDDDDSSDDSDMIPYCEDCDRTFISIDALQQHLENSNAHMEDFYDDDSSDESDTTPYCQDCDRIFVSTEALQQHLENSNAHRW